MVLEINPVAENKSCISLLARSFKTNNNANKNKLLKVMDWNSKHTQTTVLVKHWCIYYTLRLG